MAQDIYELTVSYIIENQEKFYRLAYSYVGNKEAALDVVQNAICRSLEKCHSIRNKEALKTWFYRIVVNEALQYLRKHQREVLKEHEMIPQQIYHEPAYDKDRELYERVQKLSEPWRTIIILHFYEDLTIKQIASVTGTNENTVKTRLYGALKKLRKEFEEAIV